MLWWKYQQLRMGNVKSRLAVVEELAMSGDDGAAGPLIFALKDKDTGVRCAAAKMLTRFRDKRALEPLLKMLRDPEALARAAAAETLGHIGDLAAVNQLVGCLRDPDPIVRTIVARSLSRLGWKPGTDSQRVLQILAMGNLNQLVALGPEGVGPLLELLQTGAPNKQFAAVKALADVSDPRVRPAMIEALKKPSTAVRIAALGALERMADPEVYPEVEKLLQDSEASVRGAAVEAAKCCGGARAVPALVKCLKDTAWEVRQAGANALGSFGENSAVEALCELITDPDRDVRETTISALGQISDRKAIVPLTAALYDEESSVRSAAAATLRQIDRKWLQTIDASQVIPKINEALQHHDYWVRHSAGQLLEKLKTATNRTPKAEPVPEAVPAVMPPEPASHTREHPALAVLADMLLDRDRDFRLAAAAAFGKLREKGVSPLLAAALHDTDFHVREAAEQALAAVN